MRIVWSLAAFSLCGGSTLAQEASDPCESVTVTHVSQKIPCATVGRLDLDPDLSGTLELGGVRQVGSLHMKGNNGGLTNLSITSLTRIERGAYFEDTGPLSELHLPNLVFVDQFSIYYAPRLRTLTLGEDGVPVVGSFSIMNTAFLKLEIHPASVTSIWITENPQLKSFSSNVRSLPLSGSFRANNDKENLYSQNTFSLNLPNMVWARELRIGQTTFIELPSLASVNETLELENNKFYSLSLPSLESVGGFLSFVNNSEVDEVDFPRLHKLHSLNVSDNPAIVELDGFPKLADVDDKVVLDGNFKYVELPSLSNAAGGLWVSSSEDMSFSCAALEKSFQSNRPHQSFECRSAGGNTNESDPESTDPGQTQDGEQTNSAQPLSGGAIAGIVVGTLAAIGILAAVLFIVRGRRRKGPAVEGKALTTDAGDRQDTRYTSVPRDELQGVPRSELAMPDPEMEGSRVPENGGTIYYEVDGTTRRGG